MNLLTGLDALLEHRSVQDAAAHLHLTPPAVSRILGRLRSVTGDPLLVRDGREMVPTERALAMRDEVRELVARAHAVLEPQAVVELASLRRTFVVRCHDALLTSLAPKLLAEFGAKAPLASLRLVSENPTVDRHTGLREIDLDVGSPPQESPAVITRVIGADEMVLVVRRGSTLDVPKPSLTAVAAATHIAVSRRGRALGPVDDQLAAHGLTRTVQATVATVAAALAVVAATDSVTILPARLRDPLPSTVRIRPLPFTLPSSEASVSWHRRHDNDDAHRWLRTLVERTLADSLR
ncbi:LysR family transcriptional regulator [Glaciihabitans arcticus]|uniref:LysR family transcriptional regulator n=1 Tax=Glaciihabitans arcticus TaxID=2668039 RepID=A0A4Q9GSP2_9MICO|nr:LysR family transcriptional regulator [Glaciihabitans arcticus]